MFAAYTGMRQGEILKIRKKDIDLVANKIHVGGVPTQTTKAKNWRAIPIHDKIMDIVMDRCSQSSRSDVQLFGDEWRDKDQLLRAFKKVNRLIPKEDSYVFHTLRHSYATWLAEAGVPIQVNHGFVRTQAYRDNITICKGYRCSTHGRDGCYLSATNGWRDYLVRSQRQQIHSESHRWNPHADVAELVDALVSGS